MVNNLFSYLIGALFGVFVGSLLFTQQPEDPIEEDKEHEELLLSLEDKEKQIASLSLALVRKDDQIIKMSGIIDSLHLAGINSINTLEEVVYKEYNNLPDTVKSKYRASVIERLERNHGN